MDLMTLSMMKNMSKNGGGSGPLTLNTFKKISGGFVLDMTNAEDVGDGYEYTEELNEESDFCNFIMLGFTPLILAYKPFLCTFFINGVKEIFTYSYSEESNFTVINNENNSIVFIINRDDGSCTAKTSENIVYTFTKEIILSTTNVTEIEDEDIVQILAPISSFSQENTNISNFTFEDIINSFESFFGVAEKIVYDNGSSSFIAYINNEKFYIQREEEEEKWFLYFSKNKNFFSDLKPNLEDLEFTVVVNFNNNDIAIAIYPGKEKYLDTTLTISSYHEESINFYKTSKSLKIWDNIADRPKVATIEEVMLTFIDHISLPGEGEA